MNRNGESTREHRIGQWLAERGIVLNEQQWMKFEQYHSLLAEWNQKMNLTAILDRDDIYVKHFYDSISLSFFVPLSDIETIADIGSGAGFPSIPLKIVYPHLKVTIIDALNKRITFLRHLVETLGLEHVDCVHARAEDAARLPEHRDAYDLVTARAVAKMNVLNELCLPFVKRSGLFVAMKGSQIKQELGEAETSFRLLNGELEHVHRFLLPEEQAERHLVVVRKMGDTPKKFPRKAGDPARHPLR